MTPKQLTAEDIHLLSDFQQRRKHFDNYLNASDKNGKFFSCPSCGFPTLTERDAFEICIVCNWEDDGQDDINADETFGGPSYEQSLTDSRLKIGKELRNISDRLAGTIILNPNRFFATLDRHKQRMKIATEKIKPDTDISDPLWKFWRKESESIKLDLIERQ